MQRIFRPPQGDTTGRYSQVRPAGFVMGTPVFRAVNPTQGARVRPGHIVSQKPLPKGAR
jgi:hypothetical protein